jgi:hypothetical protein
MLVHHEHTNGASLSAVRLRTWIWQRSSTGSTTTPPSLFSSARYVSGRRSIIAIRTVNCDRRRPFRTSKHAC